MGYMNKMVIVGKPAKEDSKSKSLVLMIHAKTEGEKLPEYLTYGYFNANVFYKREKKTDVVFIILNKKEDQILYSKDITDLIDTYKEDYKNIKILTYSRDVYNAVIKAQDSLKVYSFPVNQNDKVNLSFEYIGRQVRSDYEFNIPSTIFFLYEKDEQERIKEFCSRTFHVYGCEGYRNEKEELVPYMNDFARLEAPKKDFAYTFMSGTWTYSYTENEDEAIRINDQPVIVTEEYGISCMWKILELKHLKPIKWNGDREEVISNDMEKDCNGSK